LDKKFQLITNLKSPVKIMQIFKRNLRVNGEFGGFANFNIKTPFFTKTDSNSNNLQKKRYSSMMGLFSSSIFISYICGTRMLFGK